MQPDKLSPAALAVMEQPCEEAELLVSAISPWEFCKLVEKERIGISCSREGWVTQALDVPGLRLAPLSPAIACRSTMLPPPFHDDPADRIIVATAREENAILISKDRLIRDYPHVRTLW